MRPMTIVMTAACTLTLLGTARAQQPESSQEQDPEGIPASPHQEEALLEIRSDHFQRLDQDGNGLISRQEAQAEPDLAQSWSDYDENGDQALNQQEFAAYPGSATTSVEREDLVVGQAETSEEGLPATRHQEQAVRNGLVERLDQDGDGAISRQEAQGEEQLTSEWDQLDRNGDGKLDSSELGRSEQ